MRSPENGGNEGDEGVLCDIDRWYSPERAGKKPDTRTKAIIGGFYCPEKGFNDPFWSSKKRGKLIGEVDIEAFSADAARRVAEVVIANRGPDDF